MTVAAFPLDHSRSRPGDWYERSSSLFATEVDVLEDVVVATGTRELRENASLTRIEALLAEVDATWQEAKRDNWYGPGSKAVSQETREYAVQLAHLIPAYLPRPEVVAHPDGEIAFEWYFAPNRVVTMSIGAGVIHYAGTFGTGHIHGMEEIGRTFPTTIGEVVRRIYAQSLKSAATPA